MNNSKYEIKINKDKSIGKVVYIVEGEQKEITLLTYIFQHILDYSVINVRKFKKPYLKFVSKNHPNSQVFIISAPQSNVVSLMNNDGKQYLDSVFQTLLNEYHLDITNAAVYYIFDRDCESNQYGNCLELANTLRNSRDNGVEMNGLFLLSYPSIESYIKSCFDNTACDYVNSANELKKLTGKSKYQYHHLQTKEIMDACNNMLLTCEDITKFPFYDAILDDFSTFNKNILKFENEQYYNTALTLGKQYRILSLLSMSFIDLGILDVTNVKT